MSWHYSQFTTLVSGFLRYKIQIMNLFSLPLWSYYLFVPGLIKILQAQKMITNGIFK